MRSYIIILILSFFIGLLSVCKPAVKTTPLVQIHTHVQQDIDSLDTWLQQEWIPALENRADSVALRKSFAKGRRHYKKIEWAIEYFFPSSARQINGPALPEIEAEEHMVTEPGGFQVMEEMLYPIIDISQQAELKRESKKLQSILVRIKELWAGHLFRDDQVFDALRLELYRIITLGISGFDTPMSLEGITEIPVALEAVYEIAAFYADSTDSWKKIKGHIDEAKQMALTDTDFNAFDRMAFITRYINPLSSTMLQWQQELKIPVLTGISALAGNAPTIFAANAFDPNYFTPNASSHLNPPLVALGKRLFYDPVLSSSGKVSCASCHQPEKAFTDGLPKSAALGSKGFLVRNTPSLLNAGLQKGLFYDVRAAYLEDQVKNVVENKDEIHGSLKDAATSLQKDAAYYRQFREAFKLIADTTIQESHILTALAGYVRSLVSLNARFDQYMRGDHTKMDEQEIKGFNLFMGKAKCGICHFMPLFNGTVPPAFVTTESEVIGIPATATGKTVDPDPGRYAIHEIPQFKHAFKTPTVRNITHTAPYMHNGVFSTLEEVIDFYNKGGGNALGMKLEYQTLPGDSLQLTSLEKKSLIAFLHTLNDTTIIHR